MTDAPVSDVLRHGACTGSGFSAPGVAQWLGFAATPTFALMALWNGLSGSPPDVLCTAMQGSSPLGGMTAMYLLMSAFHAAPWLRWIAALTRAA